MTENKAYAAVIAKLSTMLQDGALPWRARWSKVGAPYNLVTGRFYRGMNVLLLSNAPYGSAAWLTYKQALDNGGHVRRGEKGTPILFYQRAEKDAGDGMTREFWYARSWTVFNVEQCEGLDVHGLAPRITDAEAVIAGMPCLPNIRHGGGRAYYVPSDDYVQMPPRNTFETPADYYATLFHELVHSTGHDSRIGRQLGTIDVSHEDYAFEELIAEIGAALLCAQCGIDTDATLTSNAAYLGLYLRHFHSSVPTLFRAATHAQAAADYILNREADGEGDT